MDLPDCPPGAEGYQDSVTEVPKKPEPEDISTKAEAEFLDHLNSLKIRLEDGETRCMVERRGRDISGMWIYLCYPCAAVCSGETILQTHISGKKHKIKLAMRNVWPKSIFDDHPFNQNSTNKAQPTEKVIQKMAEEADSHNKSMSDLDKKYNKYRTVTCHIQDSLDAVKAPLIGVEYLVEHPPEQAHYEPSYMCTLCSKQGHPRTIINHMTCFWHRFHYLVRHFPEACALLKPYRTQPQYREGVGVIMNRLAQRIEDKYGRKQPVNIDKEEYEKDKVQIHEWIFRGHHFSEKDGATFTEVVDTGLIDSLHKSNKKGPGKDKRDPSPPTVAAPSRPLFNNFSRPAGRQERRAGSVESLSDISDDDEHRRDAADRRALRDKHHSLNNRARYEPYDKQRHAASPVRSRHAQQRVLTSKSQEKQQRPPNYEYKVKLAEEKRQAAEESLKKTLAYHEKNPEKHPLYPEEWKKFWNKRYKEIQAEGKDPSKHDFKPEWIVFWTARMKELHEEELRIQVNEVYRRLCLSPPDMSKRSPEPRLSVEKSRVSEPRRKSPDLRRRSPLPRRRSPEPRRRPDRYERSDHRILREPLPPRRRSPLDFRRDRRSPPPHVRRSPGRRRSPEHRRSPEPRRSPPPHHKRTRSRSPLHRRSPARTNFALESIRRNSRSPLSQREQQRNRSPEHSTRQVAPSMQTVLISDDELKPDDGLSPWNSDNDIESVGSAPDTRTDRSRAGSIVSRGSKVRRRRSMSGGAGAAGPQLDGAADDVVATLRTLVALEDYLGSLGPKIVDLLADALKMEKEKANSSEELLESEMAVVLIETAKEKLKGAVQTGLVGGSAAQALKAAVVRAAATLHEADKRTRLKKQNAATSKPAAVPVAVAGVGEVDRAQIAQQMAEALIAQGKTDVSSEDLAVLVDAVVGMAEAKKRAAEQTKKAVVPTPVVVEKPVIKTASLAPKPSGTASALQMLQSAYDENDKKMEQSNTDAMDGLSDSDLETLLKNFNELSAEEQHSLIAYLKKLEAKEPERVERLRQYVSEAASTAPKERTPEAVEPEEPPAKTVVIESDDDDDYTVEEVFQSATQKVKENQIRQEMEVVKKSLEETKAEPIPPEPAKLENSLAAITKTLSASSASDLFALVQASMRAAPAREPSLVASATQPRSFGDLPEQLQPQELSDPSPRAPVSQPSFSNQGPGSEPAPFSNMQQGLLRTPARFPPPQQLQQQQQRPQQQQQQQRPQQQQQQHPQQQQQQHPQQQQQHPQQRPQQQQQQHHPQQQQQQQFPSQQQNYQPPPLNQQNYQSSQQKQADYQSPPPPQQNYQPPQQNQQQPHYNRQQGQQQSYQPAPQHQQHSQGPQHNQILPLHQQRTQQQPYQPPHQQQYQAPQHQQQSYNDNRNKPNDSFNQGQWNPRPNVMDSRGPPIRGPAPDNFGPNAPYNQGPRNNFMNGRGQDNYDTRPQMNQQFGNNNYDNNQNNFRGRGGGRGNFGAARGRGRGYY
ncbi:hypothetical protein PYW08_014237 [Mythimna loreyi]|uniref:Uncharacterized protein n=1 Tax=Mythimna loreyi TaxID=667449 RepID=A0ACC2RB05_9NEOP|nr:hypothetical protein PYW08_014237 [Mythimna loreyi]